MTLIFGSLVGLMVGLVLGHRRRLLAAALVAGVWYVSLATQTAHLAQPGSKGFFGVDGPSAVQGRWLAQYWVAQPFILAVNFGFLAAGCALRRRLVDPRLRSTGPPPSDSTGGHDVPVTG